MVFIPQTLVTDYNELPSKRFYDPKNRKSFKFDPLSEEASDFQNWESDPVSEPWRAALEEAWAGYCGNHYHNGISAVFSTEKDGQITLTACIEGHQYQPQNYW